MEVRYCITIGCIERGPFTKNLSLKLRFFSFQKYGVVHVSISNFFPPLSFFLFLTCLIQYALPLLRKETVLFATAILHRECRSMFKADQCALVEVQ
jgi:hypothetical protein